MTTWGQVSSSDATWTAVDIESRAWTWDAWGDSTWASLNALGLAWNEIAQVWYTSVSTSDATWTVV